MDCIRGGDGLMKLKTMILNFRVTELQTLLQWAQKNKTGKKNILQERALSLLSSANEEMVELINELHRQRFSSTKLNFSRSKIEPNSVRSFQSATARAQPLSLNHHAMNYRRPHPYAVYDSPKYQPIKGLEPRSYGYGAPNNMYIQDVSQNVPYPPGYIEKIKHLECPKLKPSSFYDVVHTIVEKHLFVPQKYPEREEVDYKFKLPSSFVNLFSKHRIYCAETKTYKYDAIAQLRVSKVDEPDEFLPVTLSVAFNGVKVALPNLVPVAKSSGQMKRPCVPLDITPSLRLTPNGDNVVIMTWDKEDHRNCAGVLGVAVHLVKRVSSDVLVHRMRGGPAISENESLSMVLGKFHENDDDDIAPTTIRASVMCPLGKMVIRTPCRSTSCTHLQCFDGEIFIKMNEKRATWICPVCDRRISFSDIKIDELWLKIVQNVPENSKEIEFADDGSWRFVQTEAKKLSVVKKNVKDPEILTIDDSDDECSTQLQHPHIPLVVFDDNDDEVQCLYMSPAYSKSIRTSLPSSFPENVFDIGPSTSTGFTTNLFQNFNLNLYVPSHSQQQQSSTSSDVVYTLSDSDD